MLKLAIFVTALKVVLVICLLSLFLGSFEVLGKCIGQSTFGSTSYTLEEVAIPADGNHYTINTDGSAALLNYNNYSAAIASQKHPGHYGEWYNTRIGVNSTTKVKFNVYGTIALESGVIKRRICANNNYMTSFGYYVNDDETICSSEYVPPTDAEITPFVIDNDTKVTLTASGLSSCHIFSNYIKTADGTSTLYEACLANPSNYFLNYNYNNYLMYRSDLEEDQTPEYTCANYSFFNLVGYRLFVGGTEVFDGNAVTSAGASGALRILNHGLEIDGAALGKYGKLAFQAVDPPEDWTLAEDRYYDITAQYTRKHVTNASPESGDVGRIQAYIGSQDPNQHPPTIGQTFLVSNGSEIRGKGDSYSTLWVRVYDNEGTEGYKDNKGVYWLTVTYADEMAADKKDLYTGWVMKYLVGPVQKAVGDAAYKIYQRTVLDDTFQAIVKIIATLSVIIIGYKYLMGAVQKPLSEFVYYVLKVGIVSTLIANDNSWEFFNSKLFVFFTKGTDALLVAALETDNPFSFIDTGMHIFFNANTWIKIVGLIFVPSMSITVVLLFILMFFFYAQIAIAAVRIYLFCTIIVGFLVSLAPIFIVFILFQVTREFFKNWLKILAMITIYPFIILLALNIINDFIMHFLVSTLNYKVCAQTVWKFSVLNNYSIPIHGDFSMSLPLKLFEVNIKAYRLEYDSIGFGSYLNVSGSGTAQVFGVVYLVVSALLAYLFISMATKFVNYFAPNFVGRLFEEYSFGSMMEGAQGTNLVAIAHQRGQEARKEIEEQAKKTEEKS